MFDFGKFKFDPKKFRLGMRTTKTGVAVFLVVLVFQLLGWGGVNIAALTAVFSLRQDFDQSVHFGASRILGNSLGGIFAMFYFVLNQLLPAPHLVQLFGIPICVMLTIMTNVAMNNKSGVIGGVAAFLIITLTIPNSDSIHYAIMRVLETFVGVFVAILVNTDVDVVRKWLKK